MKHGPDPKLGEDLIFGAMHPAEIRGGSIVVPAQVQHAVKGIEQQFAFRPLFMFFRPAKGFRHANHDLTGGHAPAGIFVQWEREHVRGAVNAHELRVQFRHARVTDEGEGHLVQRGIQNRVGADEVAAEERAEP